MVATARCAQNRHMKRVASTEPAKIRIARPRMAELRHQIDERDETIRLLNEALSRALDELALNEAA
jgi:hypothetical protein